MSYNGHTVIDADCHLFENWDLDRTYKEYMDPEYREKYAELSQAVKGKFVGSVVWPLPPARPMGIYDAFGVQPPGRKFGDGAGSPARDRTSRGVEIDTACNWDPAVRLRDMDTAGIDVSVMFASYADGFCMLREVGFESALQRAYHRYMNNYCFTTDYPHSGSSWPDGVPMITERSRLSESAKIKMLGENARRFLPRLAV